MTTIEGLWQSYYEYGEDEQGNILASRHQIKFIRDGDSWVGTSVSNEEGSKVTITLKEEEAEFSGTWRSILQDMTRLIWKPPRTMI